MIKRLLSGLVLSVIAAVAFAADIELTAQGLSVSDDSLTTTYEGDVSLRIPKGTPYESHADNTEGAAGADQTLTGHVTFKVAGLIIMSEQAKLTHASNGDTLIAMDVAESRHAK
jgi:hypothetical protein